MRIALLLLLSGISYGQVFESKCAVCHGSDGAGGEHGPNITRPRSRERLREVIRNGVAGAMPAFTLSDSEMQQILAFFQPAIERPAPGDATAGEAFFWGKGGCSQCHMIGGRGSIIGPDLSSLGKERRLAQIEHALRNPQVAAVSVRMSDGRDLRGLVKNESNIDLQLLGLDGTLHLLTKKEISRIDREKRPLMPAVSASPDLMAFLSRLDGTVRTSEARSEAPLEARAGEWPTYNGDLGGNRHSALKQITTGNVGQLAPKWIFPMRNARSLEVTPIVKDGVMYVTSGNEAYALDARTGRQIWHYQRPLTKGVIGDAASGINRGVALHGEKVFLATDNAHLLALHRSTGQLLWESVVADYKQHYGTTSAPLVVRDLVIIGTSGGDEGARGLIVAFKVSNGQQVWKHFTMPKPGEPGSETWVGRALEHGCSAAWLSGSYDSETNLLYWTTGNPCPDYNGDERKGDNLYSDSVLALDPATGQRKWHFQFTPHDLHDWDAVQPVLAVNATFQGKPRKLLLQGNRNGFFYVLDRETGEFLLGAPLVRKLTWASGIGRDGRPILLPGAEPSAQGTKACPAVEGATNWMSSSYSPQTGLFYVMTLERCTIYSKSSAWWEPGKSFYGGGTRRVPDDEPEKILRAIDIQTGKIAWEYPQIGKGESWGGVLSTDGGVVFFGEDSGAFAAADAKTGKPLWSFQTNVLWKASPMTYELDGKQFVAIASGGNILTFGLP